MHSGRRLRFLGSVILACAATMTASQAAAQRAPDYPERPAAAPEQVARGQQLFKSNCSFCHGSDGRGGETGPNLVRDQVVLADQHGELIAPVVQNGIPGRGMPKLTLSATEIADIAAWLHSQPLSDRGTPSTLDILVGNAKEGEAYFNGAGHCTQCHAGTGDLAGIGARYEPKMIQNLIVSGGGGRSFGRRSASAAAPKVPPTTVTVTLPSGQTITGDLDHISAFVVALRAPDGTYHISAFVVALRTPDGTYRSFARHDAIPKVVVTNPVQWHIDMLPKWRDSDIHNLTAYLATLK